MKNYKSRDKKLNKKKNGMRISGKSLFLLNYLTQKKAEKIKQENKKT